VETVPWFSSRLLDDGPIFLAVSLRDSLFQIAVSDLESIFVNAPRNEILDVGVNDPVHLPRLDCCAECVQRIMWSSAGPKPVGKATEVAPSISGRRSMPAEEPDR
jgi:hypothetical protein